MYVYEKYENVSPETTANCLSKLFFCWILPYFKKDGEKDLQMKDIYNTTTENLSGPLGDQLERNWDNELDIAIQNGRQPRLHNAIIKTFWRPYLTFSFWMTFQVIFLKTFQPVVLAKYIKYFELPFNERTTTPGWILGATIVLLSFLNVMVFHHYWFGSQKIGTRIRVSCSSLIYRKLLKLKQSSLGQTSSGQIINLLTNDVQRLEDAAIYLLYLYLTPLLFCTAVYVLYETIGIALFPGLVVMVVQALPIQGSLSKLQGKLRSKIANLTDRRVKLVNEVITGIQVIKMYAWEKPFENVINAVRKQELNVIIKSAYIKGYFNASVVFTERLCVFSSILTYVMLGYSATGDVVFCLAQMYNIIQNYMCFYFTFALTAFVESKVSMRRMEEFLSLEEKDNNLDKITSKEPFGTVMLSNVTAKWDANNYALRNVDLFVRPGDLACLLGNVGCGKSSVLQVLLGELPINEGNIEISGRVSYCSQKAWLFVSSVRNNILFEQRYDKDRYKDVVQACDLEKDFRQFPFGDQTLVGERGVSLSGGQRARIHLARSLYREADIYLLDDPLSAVDSRVCKHLFEEGILRYLKNKTRILVTHNLQFSRQADLLVVMSEGYVTQVWTKEEMTKNKIHEWDTDIKVSTDKSDDRGGQVKELEKEVFDTFCEENSIQTNEEALNKNITFATYKHYFLSGTSICTILFLVLLFIVAQVFTNFSDLWVTYWTNKKGSLDDTPSEILIVHLQSHKNDSLNITATDFTHSHYTAISLENVDIDNYYYIYVYAGVMVACIFLTTIRSFIFFKICLNASRHLHNTMLVNILEAPMRFFDINPSGRIINRFSKDMGTVDESLPYYMISSAQMCLVMVGIVVMFVIIIPWIIVVILAILLVVYYFARAYLVTVQKIKALEGNARSPIYSHVAVTCFGISTIRSTKAEGLLKDEFDFLQDRHTSTWYLFLACSQAFGFYLDLLVTVFIAIVTFKFLVIKEEKSLGGSVGLAITQAAVLNGLLQAGIRCCTEVISNMVSVERILYYTKIDSEETAGEIKIADLSKDWPHAGKIVFKDTSLRYVATDSPVLKELNVTINPGEKIGIVGRTGAGKSSLIAALFRLAPIEGSVIIDGIDTATISLKELRRKISIIPQEPMLFSATIKYNLDPFETSDDETLWKVLEKVELKLIIKDLNQQVSEGGTNFSAGQRQLICLARAIARETQIIVMDEATANVDPQTDVLIQATIRKYFQKCTVLTVAHRLDTVMDSDRIIVMDCGRVVECGHPHELLTQSNGYFTKMVRETGSETEDRLRKIAFEDFQKKQ